MPNLKCWGIQETPTGASLMPFRVGLGLRF